MYDHLPIGGSTDELFSHDLQALCTRGLAWKGGGGGGGRGGEKNGQTKVIAR